MGLTVEVTANGIRVPAEVFLAWGQPPALSLDTRFGDVLVFVESQRSILNALNGRQLSRVKLERIDHAAGEGGVAVFSGPVPELRVGDYLIANYHPMYQLIYEGEFTGIPEGEVTREVNKATANVETWQQIEDYHEHREVAAQDVEAHACSEMLVRTIIDRYPAPRSIVELGCGAGRNLVHLARAFPDADIRGIEINAAAAVSAEMPTNVAIEQDDVLSIDWSSNATVSDADVVLTSGFLMHINHDDVRELLKKIATHSRFHLHFELHGPEYDWDFHRYPRCYRRLMDSIDEDFESYTVFAGDPVLSHGLSRSFAHSLLVGTVSPG